MAHTPDEPGDSGGEAVHRRFLDAVNQGDVEAAAALFVEDANAWDAFGCRPNCLGRSTIRRALEVVISDHWQASTVEVRTLRTSFTHWTASRVEVRNDELRAAGIERILAGYAMATRGGRIASVRGGYDSRDEPTRRYLALRTTTGSRITGGEIPPATTSEHGRRVDVGGRQIYMECMGSGSPTVVFEGGSSVRGAASGGVWTGLRAAAPHITIQQDVARFTRACAYDPAGTGQSDPRPRPSTGQADAEDMHRLLQAAGIEPPYVVVGISYGGQVVQLFAAAYPDEVAGIVLLDSTPGPGYLEQLAAALPPATAERLWSSVRQGWEQSKGPQGLAAGTDLEATLAEMRAMGPLPDVPLAVLTAGVPYGPLNVPPDWDVERREELRYAYQAALARLTLRGTHRIVDTSEHAMNAFAPTLVVDAIRGVVDAARHPVVASQSGVPEGAQPAAAPRVASTGGQPAIPIVVAAVLVLLIMLSIAVLVLRRVTGRSGRVA